MKYFIIVLVVMVSCQSSEDAFEQNSLVVEAYIFESKKVENIKLSLVKPIDGKSELLSVSNAKVSIDWRNKSYELFESTTAGLYSSSSTDLQIISGEDYELKIEYNSNVYTAETKVPLSPGQLKSSKDTINLGNSADFIMMSWDNPDSLPYLGVVTDEIPENSDFPFNNFFSVPTNEKSLKISPNNLQKTGNRQFILYGITDDYQELYRISNSSIGTTNAGNLSLGFGIFAAFSSDTVHVVVVNK